MLHLEPWGEQIEMAAGATFVVASEAEQPGSFEVELGEGKIIVWAWSSAVVKLSVTVRRLELVPVAASGAICP